LLNSGESETRSYSWPSNKRKRRTDREQRSCVASSRHKQAPSKRRPSKISKLSKRMLSRRRLSSTSKRRASTLMLKSASASGKARARTLSHSSWSLRITRSALSEEIVVLKRETVFFLKYAIMLALNINTL